VWGVGGVVLSEKMTRASAKALWLLIENRSSCEGCEV